MSDIKNLAQNEAISKLQELTEASPVTMFCTNLSHIPFSTCPMSTQKVDDAGAIWFFSGSDSDHAHAIQDDNRVQLLYTNNGDYSYLTISGTAEILYDRAKIDELWTPLAKVWFQGGKDDPGLRLIKVTPQEGFYWDTKHGKTVSFLKMISSLVTGKTQDDSIEGALSIGHGNHIPPDAATDPAINI